MPELNLEIGETLETEKSEVTLFNLEKKKIYRYIFDKPKQDLLDLLKIAIGRSNSLEAAPDKVLILTDFLVVNVRGKSGPIDVDGCFISSPEFNIVDDKGNIYPPVLFLDSDPTKKVIAIGLSLSEQILLRILFEVPIEAKELKLRYGYDKSFGFGNEYMYWKLK